MGCFGSKQEQQQQQPTAPEPSTAEELRKDRSLTDIACLIIMPLYYLILFGLIAYCAYYGDTDRIPTDLDDSDLDVRYNCRAFNMSDELLALLDERPSGLSETPTEANCGNNCTSFSTYEESLKRCIAVRDEADFAIEVAKTFYKDVTQDFIMCANEIALSCLASLVFSILIIVLLRYFVGLIIWLIVIGVCIVCVVGSIYLWILWGVTGHIQNEEEEELTSADNNDYMTYFGFAIGSTVVTVLVIIMVIALRKRVKLVIQLFKEAGKAILSMPLLLFEPIITVVALALVFVFFGICTLCIESAGHLNKEKTQYEKDVLMQITRWYNVFGMIWMVQFIFACQHVIVAGAISNWYFTRDKKDLSKPIFSSAFNLIRYHLGSAAFGSFIIALVQFIQVVIKLLRKTRKDSTGRSTGTYGKCCGMCLYCCETVLNFLNKNAYIITATHGFHFCKAARRALHLLVTNTFNVIAVNSIGDFVLILGKLLIVVGTLVISFEILQSKEGIKYIFVPVALVGLFGVLICHSFFAVYEMAMNTIFLCFCVDCEENDGTPLKPYYMSKGLMQFVEDAKRELRGD